MKLPRQFNEQIESIKQYFIVCIEDDYQNKFNATSSHPDNNRYVFSSCSGNINTSFNLNVDTIYTIKNYPSLYRIYNNNLDEYVNNYNMHKNYFHNNVFEELMKTVWHPKNYSKFIYLDPN